MKLDVSGIDGYVDLKLNSGPLERADSSHEVAALIKKGKTRIRLSPKVEKLANVVFAAAEKQNEPVIITSTEAERAEVSFSGSPSSLRTSRSSFTFQAGEDSEAMIILHGLVIRHPETLIASYGAGVLLHECLITDTFGDGILVDSGHGRTGGPARGPVVLRHCWFERVHPRHLPETLWSPLPPPMSSVVNVKSSGKANVRGVIVSECLIRGVKGYLVSMNGRGESPGDYDKSISPVVIEGNTCIDVAGLVAAEQVHNLKLYGNTVVKTRGMDAAYAGMPFVKLADCRKVKVGHCYFASPAANSIDLFHVFSNDVEELKSQILALSSGVMWAAAADSRVVYGPFESASRFVRGIEELESFLPNAILPSAAPVSLYDLINPRADSRRIANVLPVTARWMPPEWMDKYVEDDFAPVTSRPSTPSLTRRIVDLEKRVAVLERNQRT